MEDNGFNISDFDISNSFIPDPIVEEELEEVLEEETEESSEETPEGEDDVQVEEEIEEESEEESTVQEEEEPEQEEDIDLNLTPLMELVNRDLPVELDIAEYDPSDEESLAKFIKDAVNKNSQPEFASEEVKLFNEYVANGGNPRDYVQEMYGQIDYSTVNIEGNEEAQKQIVREFLSKEFPKKDSKWVEAKIEKYENSGLLEDEANDALQMLESYQEEDKAQLAERQRTAHETQRAEYERQIEDLKENINKQEDILGKTLNNAEKKELFEFATKVDKHGKTGYIKAMESAPNAALAVLFLAYNNFDEGAFTKAAKKQALKSVKKNLSRYTSTNAQGSSGSGKVPRSNAFNIKDEFGV